MISEKMICQLTDKIIEVINPEKIIIFGSYGTGTQTEKSDLDILVVVKEDKEPRYKRARKIRKKIWGLITIPKDILVYTEKEIKEWENVPFSFVSNVLSQGKIIYDKKAS